jgi:hypothetical protein
VTIDSLHINRLKVIGGVGVWLEEQLGIHGVASEAKHTLLLYFYREQ